MVLVMSFFQLFATFFSDVILVQTYAKEKVITDTDSLKTELEEEKESLEGLNDELEFIVEQEKEVQERIDYLKGLIKELEGNLQQEKGSKEELQEELNSAKAELDAEIFALEEVRDEKGAFEELKKETEDRIVELTTQIKKTESTPSVVGTEIPQRTTVDTSKSSTAVEEPKAAVKEELQGQLRLAKEALEGETEALDDIEEQINILGDELREMEEQKKDTEASIIELLARVKELESTIASIEPKEKTQSSA